MNTEDATLTTLNLSNNPVSLAGGSALMELIQKKRCCPLSVGSHTHLSAPSRCLPAERTRCMSSTPYQSLATYRPWWNLPFQCKMQDVALTGLLDSLK